MVKHDPLRSFLDVKLNKEQEITRCRETVLGLFLTNQFENDNPSYIQMSFNPDTRKCTGLNMLKKLKTLNSFIFNQLE